jgi:hypothetical protein
MPTTALVRRTQSDRIDFAFQSIRDRGSTYKVAVPLPMPGKLLWSVAICDALTGEELRVDGDAAPTGTTFELKDESLTAPKSHLGPRVPNGPQGRWIKTIPERGWFAYCRLCVPGGPRSVASRSRLSLALR